MVVNVKEMVQEEEEKLRQIIQEQQLHPKFAVIVANDLESSKRYIASKRKKAENLGILQEEYRFSCDVKQEVIIKKIEELNQDPSIHGILVQLPLYAHLDENQILNAVDEKKDMDGLTDQNLGKLLGRQEGILPCTPKGILFLFEKLAVNLVGKNVVILGKSKIVGRPMAELLLSRGATVTICHSKTKHLEVYTKQADIVIVAIGNPCFVKQEMVKKDSIIIDVGINLVNGKIVGDADMEHMKDHALYITPVPGGVGITTVLSLMDNLVKLTINQKRRNENE